MKKDRIEMSQRDLDRLKVMAPVLGGKRTQAEAGRLLGLCVRQVRRIQRRMEAGGDAAILHGLRGRPSNRRCEASFRRRVVDACRGALAAFSSDDGGREVGGDGPGGAEGDVASVVAGGIALEAVASA